MKLKLFFLSILTLLSLVGYQKYSEYSALKSINSYESCVAAKGSTIQESYPSTCITRLGTRFTQLVVQADPFVISSPSPVQSVNPNPTITYKTLRYTRTPEWALWGSEDNRFSFAYDASKYKDPIKEGEYISLLGQSVGQSIFMRFNSYSGGSRHRFIQQETDYALLDNTYEKNYLIDGKPALFIFQAELSANCSAGAIFTSHNTALVVTSSICDSDKLEPFLSTFKFTD